MCMPKTPINYGPISLIDKDSQVVDNTEKAAQKNLSKSQNTSNSGL